MVASETRQSAGDAMAELKGSWAEAARLGRANGISTTASVFRGRVMDVMREPGIRGVRRGGTPVTARPARGAGGGPGLVERGFEAGAPDRLHVAGIACVRMANGSFGCTASAADVLARGIAGRACAAAMDTRGGLVPRAPEQATSWAASHGGMDGLAHRSGHGARRIGLVYATGVGECGMPPPAGTAGDPYGNAMAEGADGAYVFCQVVIGQCGVSFPSEKAVGFSPVRNWPVIARVLLFHCIRA